MEKVTQQISNHPSFNDVNRTIEIAGINFNFDTSTFDLYYRIIYSKDDVDISQNFNQQTPLWNIDNNQLIIKRDENFQPIINPEFKEVKDDLGNIINEFERYSMMPAFDYIGNIIVNSTASLGDILRNYIKEEDSSSRFNY
ncbi:hypothetical protein [Flavobacterium sp. UBA7680]|uniref:hypothetical protein n=1 Tax=Flavobacterium sp. UBA7680 TaxID=1946559 RepID=UPI0025BF014D|nr:hypothetical protein [Flavobacterium sp. UBA7680]